MGIPQSLTKSVGTDTGFGSKEGVVEMENSPSGYVPVNQPFPELDRMSFALENRFGNWFETE